MKNDVDSIFPRGCRSSRSGNIESSPLADNLKKKYFLEDPFLKDTLFKKYFVLKYNFFTRYQGKIIFHF